jgi:CheY-like chemotaxis protein/HPt (histidine-containing phosphotransfer) domain-containing protein
MDIDIQRPASASALGRTLQKKHDKRRVIAGFPLAVAVIACAVFQIYSRNTALKYERARAGQMRDLTVALDGLAVTHDADVVARQMLRLRALLADDSARQEDFDSSIRSQSSAFMGLSLLVFGTLCLYYAVVYHQIRTGVESGMAMNNARLKAALQSTFVSRAGFDIRSALMAILGHCDLPREKGLPVQDRFDSIRRQTFDIVAAVDGFLETPEGSIAQGQPLIPIAAPAEARFLARVLLAEDDPHLQRVIKFYLESSGAQVTIVADGELAYQEAMASVELGKPFDLILMDVQMPKLGGCEATMQLRQAGYAHPIVALTADATDQEQRRCMTAGCNGFLAKPASREAILQTVRRLVRPELFTHSATGAVHDPVYEAMIADQRESFRREIPRRIGEIENAVIAQDLSRITDLAHRLKGTAACYGFSGLADCADALQVAVASPGTDEAILHYLRKLNEQAEKLVLAEAA